MFSERLSLSKIMVSHLTHVFHSLLTINLSQPVLIFPLRPGINSWVGKIPLRRDRPPTPVILGFPRDSEGKEPTCNAGDLGSIPGLGRSPREGNTHSIDFTGQYSQWGRKELDTTEQLSL